MIRPTAPADLAAIVSIANALPAYFTPEAVSHIRADAEHLPSACFVAQDEILGFAVWWASSSEAEILWIACSPSHCRQGIGTALIRHIQSQLRGPRILSAKTADLENYSPGTQLSGAAFRATHEFYRASGFRLAGVLIDFWGPSQAAAVFVKSLTGESGAENGAEVA